MGRQHRVRLVGGAEEPLYLPAENGWAVIRYTRDYAASVLHELAHWCIAGSGRRSLPDYGYWYEPPPRDDAARDRFVQAELSVQALESLFTEACGRPFRVSLDDLDGCPRFSGSFSTQVQAEAARLHAAGLGVRARAVVAALEARRSR